MSGTDREIEVVGRTSLKKDTSFTSILYHRFGFITLFFTDENN